MSIKKKTLLVPIVNGPSLGQLADALKYAIANPRSSIMEVTFTIVADGVREEHKCQIIGLRHTLDVRHDRLCASIRPNEVFVEGLMAFREDGSGQATSVVRGRWFTAKYSTIDRNGKSEIEL